jgi:DNA-directed RNA polymerase subunit E'/Rpb7
MFFASNLQDHLLLRLHAEVEGTCSGRFGYIISVVEVVSVSKGVLKTATGHAEFDIIYKAIVFKPFKNQVVDGVVSTVNKVYRALTIHSFRWDFLLILGHYKFLFLLMYSIHPLIGLAHSSLSKI